MRPRTPGLENVPAQRQRLSGRGDVALDASDPRLGAQVDCGKGRWDALLVSYGGHSTPHADHYGWAEKFLDAVYCVTIIPDLTPTESLARLDGVVRAEQLSLPDVVERAYQAWDDGGDPLFVASAPLGKDTMIVEPNGYICSEDGALRVLSAGTAAYSVYANIELQHQFSWYEKGELRLWFDPLWPADRTGSAATLVEPVLIDVGFALDADFEPRCLAASLALAASLSGVPLTPEALETAAYTGASVRPQSH